MAKKKVIKINDKDRSKIDSLLKRGKGTKDIREIFPQYTTGQISALSAWRTMRTKDINKEPLITSDLEVIKGLLKKSSKGPVLVCAFFPEGTKLKDLFN